MHCTASTWHEAICHFICHLLFVSHQRLPDFCINAWLQEQVEEIVEVYDERVHGPLDAPMVRDEVYAGRKYFGPPRNETERIAHEREMEALRIFVAEHALHDAAAPDAQQRRHCSPNPEAGSSHSVDSDDEDSSTLAQPAAAPKSRYAAAFAAGPQLEQELDRLVAAFEGADVVHDNRWFPIPWCSTTVHFLQARLKTLQKK